MSPSQDDPAAIGGVLSSLVGSGLPIEQGLRAAARELPKGRTARSLARLADRLERGEAFEVAAADRAMPPHLRALVAAGLRSASLGRVLEEFVASERHAADVHRKMMLAISYPALLLLLLSCLFAYFSFSIVPGIMQIYHDFDANLPALTVDLGDIAASGYWVVIGNIATLLFAWAFLWLAMNVVELRAVVMAVPLLGPALHWAALARFCRLLAMLVDADLPLPQAVELAGRGCQDATLDSASRRAVAGIQSGVALGDALVTRRAFPESLGPMLRWGEHGPAPALADALRTASEMFEGRLEAQLGLLRAVVPPLSFAMVLWGALFLVSASLLPMISLIEKLT